MRHSVDVTNLNGFVDTPTCHTGLDSPGHIWTQGFGRMELLSTGSDDISRSHTEAECDETAEAYVLAKLRR